MRSSFAANHLAAPALVVIMFSFSLGCGEELGVADVAGRFASRPDEEAFKARKKNLDPRIVDSAETSLAGLSVTMEVWRSTGWSSAEEFEDSLRLDEVLGTKIPDADGRFMFDGVPAVPLDWDHTSWGGYMFVRIEQESASPVRYGEGAQIKHVMEDETLLLSIPLVSRYLMPSWFGAGHMNPGMGPLLTAHAGRSLLIYLNPEKGLGVFDPIESTAGFIKLESPLAYTWHADRLEVVESRDLAIVAMVHETEQMPLLDARFVLVDLSPLLEAEGSVVLDPEAPEADQILRESVVVVDVPPNGDSPHAAWRVLGASSFHPSSFITADGNRYYHGRWGSTFVIDIGAGSFVEAYHDNEILGAYNADLDHLYFDLPEALLRIREGATGEVVADVDLGARALLSAAAIPGTGYTMVSYESAERPLEHRIALLAAGGEILEDHLAGDFLGFTDRNWNEAYDWGTCSSYYYRTPDCPDCGPEPPSDIFRIHGGETHLPILTYIFDAVREQLIVEGYSVRFQLEDGLFHPMPKSYCGAFASTSLASDCHGFPVYDPGSGAMVILTETGICVNHLEVPDILVNVEVERLPEVFALPAVLPEVGTAYMPGVEGITAVHYRNPEATLLPAVRDMRALHD